MKIWQIGMIKTKFKQILTTIDRIKFNHENKVGKLKFNDINNFVSSINKNTISEALAKQKLDAVLIQTQEQKINVLLMDKKYY